MGYHISLAAARVNAELKQTEAAEKIGVGVNTIINWENGKTFPDMKKLEKISKVYNIPLEFIQKEPLVVGDKTFSEIVITKDGELIADITAKNVIAMDGYEVTCVPTK